MKLFSKILLLSSGILLLGMGACKKSYLDRYPSDQVPLKDAFKTTAGCKAALEGIHSLMYRATGEESFGQKSIDLMNDLMGDDMVLYDQGSGWFVKYINYSAPRGGNGYIWGYYYNFINNCNELLMHIDAAKGPQSEKDNIKGQVYFYKAYAYFNLSIYYQHTFSADKNALCVPIYNEVTKDGNARSTVKEVYQEIVTNLKDAAKYLDPSKGAPARMNKSEINIDVVHGLWARVALVMQDWALAEKMAHNARQNYSYMPAKQLLSGFNSWQNGAWMWGSHLQEDQTNFVWSFISQLDPTAGGYAAIGGQKCVNKFLYRPMPHDSSSSEGYDIRYKWWNEENNDPFIRYSQLKFRVRTQGSFSLDVCYMRAAEMGLIEAEAQAHQNHLADARTTLETLMKIRNKKYDASSFTNKSDLLLEIWHQRRIELWGEGFRYSDLQRCATLTVANGSDATGLSYNGLHREFSGGANTIFGSYVTISDPLSNKFLFKIPGSEMNYNPNMVQNP